MSYSPFVAVTGLQGRTNVANGAILDLRPSGTKVRSVSVAGSAAGVFFGLYDGTNFDGLVWGGQALNGSGFGTATRGFSMKNSSGSAQDIGYSGYDIG